VISVVVNGEKTSVEDGLSVAELLERLGMSGRPTAVEQNGSLVPSRLHSESTVSEGDVFELVTLVGGG